MGLARHVISAYAFISFGLAATVIMTGLYLPRLYVDHVGVPMSKMAMLVPLGQCCDAATELPVGMLSDMSKSGWGRRRPFVLVGSFLLAAATIGVVVPPRSASMDAIIAYASVMNVALILFFTVVRVPWMAWGAELTSDYNEKTTVVALRELMWLGGTLASAVAPAVAGVFVAGIFERLLIAAAFWACALLGASIMAFLHVPDPPPTHASKAKSESNSTLIEFSMYFFRNRLALVLFTAHVSLTVAWGVNFSLYAFYVPYVVEVEAAEWLIGLFIITGAIGVPVAQMLSKRLEKKPLLVGSIVMQAVACTVCFFAVGSGDVVVYASCMLLAGFGYGGTVAILYSVMGDIVDVQQLISGGLRDEAKMYGLFDIIRKCAASTGLAICYTAIDSAGYQPDVKPQSGRTKVAIRVGYVLVPGVLMCASAAIVGVFYSLNRKRHAEVLAKLLALQQDSPADIRENKGGDLSLGDTKVANQVVGAQEVVL